VARKRKARARGTKSLTQTELPIEDRRGDDSEELVPFRYSITSYGADYPVDGLVKRMASGDIRVPSFQRGFVWKFKQASRFVESLLLGLPVPGIFLSKESESQKLLVIDGQQRLRTLEYFYKGVFSATSRDFKLEGVQKQFLGLTYKSLTEEDRRRLDDGIIHATVVRQDQPSDDQSSIYYIFERLNTGASELFEQEIRAAIFHGEFNDLLHRLNQEKTWRSVYGPVNRRMRDEELILRFLALNFRSEKYARPMKEFLNDYMGKNRHLKLNDSDAVANAFVRTIETVARCMGSKAFKPRASFNAAVFDSVMVGINRRLSKGPITDCKAVKRKYDLLLKHAGFLASSQRATADEESVRNRLGLATAAFADVR